MNKYLLMLGFLSVPLAAVADERIVGGLPAPTGEYLFFTAVTPANGVPYCGGALIAPEWVLTVAHCVRGQSPSKVEVGMERFRPNVVSLDTVEIAQAFVPADWKGWQADSPEAKGDRSYGQYDIALLKLRRPANSTHFLKLDSGEKREVVGDEVIAAGFGLNEVGGRPDHLYYATGKILDLERCLHWPYPEGDTNFDPDLNVCADAMVRGNDSGGPLFYKEGSGYIGLGLVSRLLVNAAQFTRISYFRNWMDTVMKQGKCAQPEKLTSGVPVCADVSAQ